MAAITRILINIKTANTEGSSTDGGVFLGIGGREFKLNTSINNFEQNVTEDILLGDLENAPPALPVINSNRNDPRIGFAIESADINQTPIYIRFEPATNNDNWHIKSLSVRVLGTEGYVLNAYPGSGFDNIWLGYKYGKIIYFTKRTTQI